MRSVFLTLLLLFLAPTLAWGQSDQKQRAARIKRISRTITFAYSLSRNKTELEAVDSQRKEIDGIYREHRELLKRLKGEERSEQLLSELSSFEREILEDILLPEQALLVRKKVFENNVRSTNGNFVRALVLRYGDELDLTDEEARNLEEIESEAEAKIREAQKRFADELKQIQQSVQKDLSKILSAEHMELIDTLEFEQPNGKPRKEIKEEKKKGSGKKKLSPVSE